MSDCCEKNVVTNCVSCTWSLPAGVGTTEDNSMTIYTVSGLCPSASGKIEYCSAESTNETAIPPASINVDFISCGRVRLRRTVDCGSCIAFTVGGFDSIRVWRSDGDFRLSGNICITPHTCMC